MLLNVQQYLRSGKSLADLDAEYHIYSTEHKQFPGIFNLHYNQIESPFHERIVQECRGLILDQNNNWNIVAFPFTKFFNYGEPYGQMIDWNTATCQKKEDGSLAILYYYQNAWHMATSGTPDASGSVHDNAMTFADLFWQTWRESQLLLPALDEQHLTFMFELCTPLNRGVILHTNAYLVLIGVRNNLTGQELDPLLFKDRYVPVQRFPLKSLEDCITSFDTMSPLAQEGYVVVDKEYNRLKVKHPGFVRLHHLKDSLSDKNILRVILAGESTEFLSYFKEYQPIFDTYNSKLSSFSTKVEGIYETIKSLSTQKEFAVKATKFNFADILFQLRLGRVKNTREYLALSHIDRVLRLLESE